MDKNVLAVIAVLLLVAIIAIVSVSMTEKKPEEPEVVTSGEAVASASVEEKEDVPTNEYKELDPYVANIPNEILDFYKEKVEEIEQNHKEEQEQLMKDNPNMDVSSLRNLKYDLIFFDDNNVPELVVTDDGYRTALYTYDAGKVIYAMKDGPDDTDEHGWPYGAGGNHGYDYIPRENIMVNTNADYAGLIVYTTYYQLNPETHNLESKYDQELRAEFFEDKNGNGQVDDDEMESYNEGAVRYYYGDKQLTEEEWASYHVQGDYKGLYGTKTADSILKALNSLINEK